MKKWKKLFNPLYTLFVELRKKIDKSSILYNFGGPLEHLHADIADIRFVAKSAVDPKHCLLLVDILTSNIYTYSMINKIFG